MLFRPPRHYQVVLIAILLLLVLAACRPVEPEPTPSPAEAEAAVDEFIAAYPLAATAWDLEYFGPADEPLPILPDTRASVIYFWDRYTGFDGCNWFLGVYGADEEGTLRMNTPAQTPNICNTPPGVYDQAATYITSLLNITEYEIEGEQLAAYTVNDQRMLTYNPATPMPMPGTIWELKFWWHSDREEWRMVAPLVATTVTFAEGGEASGSGGCNDYTTTVEGDLQIEKVMEATDTYAELPTLTFGPVAAQMAECSEPEGVMEQEGGYFAALGSVAYYFKMGGMLMMLDADGGPLLMLAARN